MKNTNKNRNSSSPKKRKSYEIRMVTCFFLAVFTGMMIYLCFYVKNNEQKLFNNSYNSRQGILAKENSRGTIFDKDGLVLAESIVNGKKETREYPMGNLYSHVVGFSTKGKTGIEDSANYYLINSNISLSEKVEHDVSGKKNPGNNIYTTLDTKLQKIAYDSMGIYKGAIVVSDVKTGKILAMVSKPDFNPNTVVEDWDGYLKDKESSVLLNRVTQGIYPPGSTFKIVTALEYIREHEDDYLNYKYTCNGSFSDGLTKINCYHGSVHGSLNFLTSFEKSCNSSFSNIGLKLNRKQYGKTLNSLMFNENLPLDGNYSISKLKVDDNVSDDDMIQIAIGQGKAQITPMHLNMITNAIANDGVLMKPFLIDKAVSADGNVLKQYEPEEYKTLLTKKESDILTNMMIAVVQDGTGTKLKNNLYQAAGKTGSAEYNGVKEDSHAWFTGFAPADNPQISVTIIIEGIGSGGDYAVPIAKRIFDEYFIDN